METDSALFECEFSVPDVKVDWTVNGEKVETSPKFAIKDDGKKHSLNISKCRPKDQGEVTCTYGDHTTKATLAVKGRCSISKNIFFFNAKLVLVFHYLKKATSKIIIITFKIFSSTLTIALWECFTQIIHIF